MCLQAHLSGWQTNKNKHTITKRPRQDLIKPTNVSGFLICIQNKNHMILCIKQHTYALVRFPERVKLSE